MEENTYTVQVVRSSRKTLGIEIRSGNLVLVRAPMRMPVSEIRRMVNQRREWIEKHLAAAAQREASLQAVPRMTREEIEALAKEALAWFPPRVQMFAVKMGIRYGRITIRNQKTRWGSCSSDGNLNFNCMLMLCPEEIRDYVIVHELCHRLEMNHSPRFWAEVEKQLPDYRKLKKWLKANGQTILARMGP